MPTETRECRICGCTQEKACRDDRTGQACHWVAEDLCSACVGLDALLEQQTMCKAFALGDALEEWREMSGQQTIELKDQDAIEAFATFIFSRGFDASAMYVAACEEVARPERPIDPISEILLPGRDFV